jgi:hypothetical protein
MEENMRRNLRQPRRLHYLLAIAAWAASANGCATNQARIDYDQEALFANLRTYAWIDSAAVVRDTTASPFLERRVRRAVDHALKERGFILAAAEGSPDILVTAFVVGPTAAERRAWYWSTAPCGPVLSFGIRLGYPYGYGLRHRRGPWRSPFFREPWGYACAYRVGFGYLWLPVYEEPGDRLPGTLVIDILDPATRAPIWRGSAEGAVRRYGSEAASQEELDDVAASILKEFPPGSRH